MKIFFGTDGIRGKVGIEPVTADWALKLGAAVGRVLAKKTNSSEHAKVLIGKDTRISGYMFESALEAGLSSSGVDTYLLGPMPTPGISYLTRTFQAGIGIVISASHNSHYDNGFKFFAKDGSKLCDEMELEIEEELSKGMKTVSSDKLGKAIRVNDAAGRYIEFCKSSFPQKYSLSDMKIVLDCAHGASYHIAPSVFTELGAKVECIGDDPDGLNINLNCGSTSLSALKSKVIEAKANLGIAFDGDADRVIFVDENAQVLDGDDLLYIIANWYLQEGIKFGGVAGTVMSNLALEKKLKEKNIPFSRSKVGDRYVLESLQQQNWKLGGEPSGHIICLNSHTTGDGIIAALQVLAALCATNSSLAEKREELVKYPQVLRNVSMPISGSKLKYFINENKEITKAVSEVESKIENGRVLLRASGTEPVVRIMLESDDLMAMNKVASSLAEVVTIEANKNIFAKEK